MEEFVEMCSDVTDHGHCIIKEELIIPDDEIIEEIVDDEINNIPDNSSVADLQAEFDFDKPSNSNETLTSRESDNKKQTTPDLFVKSENVENNDDESKNATDSTNNQEPKVTTKQDIDELAKKVGEAYCKKCKNKSAVILQKKRCSKCKTPFSYICNTCDKTYNGYRNLSYHLKFKHIEADLTYPCTICDRTYKNRKAFMIHRRIQHQIYESLKCSKCGKEFSRSVNKLMHEKFCGKLDMSKCEQTNLYKCDKCFYKARDKKALRSHTLEKHTEGFKAKCDNCPKVFKNQRSLRRHVIHYCNKSKKLECDHCGLKFYRKDQVILHIDQNHMKGYYSNSNTKERSPRTRICQLCGVNLAPHEGIRDHRLRCKSTLESPSSSGTYKKESQICKYCGETLKPHEQMRSHVERCESVPLALRHSAQRVKLPDIETALKELAILYCVECQMKEPLKDQVGKCGKCSKLLRFACVSCSTNFVDTNQLREHLQRKHVRKLRYYRCDECPCYYSRKRNLIKHQRDFHSDNPTANYKCERCSKKYKSLSRFRKHMIWCGQEPKYQCDKCPYKTHFKRRIINHLWAERNIYLYLSASN